MKKTLLAFVHLGTNPSPCLICMAENARHHNSNIELALITDKPELHTQFPGGLITYQSLEVNPWLQKFVSRRREIKDIAGGYWLHTLERIFALRAVLPLMEDQVFVHIESDVYMNMSEYSAHQIATKLNSLAVPRFSADRGIASIMISPSRSLLISGLNELQEILISEPTIDNDMSLLGYALNSRKLEELPTNPTRPMTILGKNREELKVVFDGAALGQYLLGQDPFHTGGKRISGFVNRDTDFNSSGYTYSIQKSQQSQTESIFINEVEILNIHVHSKMVLPPISSQEGVWSQAIGEANGTVQRKLGDYTPDVIHTQPINLLNRMRIAKRQGLVKAIVNALTRRIDKVRRIQ